MLGYATVKMNMAPNQQPVRTLLPGRMIPNNPDNQGPLGFGGLGKNYIARTSPEGPIIGDHGDADLRQSNFEEGPPAFGKDYGKSLRGPHQDQYGIRVSEAYNGPFAQAQALRRNVHFNLQGLTRRIASPDIQSQFETGYTLPLQAFAWMASKVGFGLNWNTPAGKNVAGSMMASQQPSLKRAAPAGSIPTAMPWNSSAGYGGN